MNDGIDYYLFVPQSITLYGRDEGPYRFLRVVDKESTKLGRSFVEREIDGDKCIIETVDIETFLSFISYGYTPYIECLLSGYTNAFGLEQYPIYYISQAMLRNYEMRIKELLEAAQTRKYSIMSMTTINESTSELIDEITACLAMMEMLMNTGKIAPRNCLANNNKHSMLIPTKKFESKFNEIEERFANNNMHNLPFKVTEDKRHQLLTAFNCI